MCFPSSLTFRPPFLSLVIITIIAAEITHPTLAQTPTGVQQAKVEVEWGRYVLNDHNISFLLPTVPAVRHQRETWHPSMKRRRETLAGAYSDGIVYVITVYELRQSLNDFIAESERGKFKREITLSKVRGHEYILEDENTRRVTQYFSIASKVYSFVAHGSRLANLDQDIAKFFSSINFDKEITGRHLTSGPGVQPIADANAASGSGADGSILRGREVTHKAVVVMKPEPSYTEQARQNEITGTVVLRAVFTSTGAVTDIRAVLGLPYGLTEQAIAAARQIRFIPAIKEGRFVSTFIQLEYNFNLY